jgi:hypothetical protein
MAQFQDVQVEVYEHFVKQTYRNRCRILTANGVENLIVPVVHGGHKIPMREVQIDYTQNWVKQHWGAIVAAYAKAPYFEYLAADVENILKKKTTFLFDLNAEILTLCLKWLRLNPRLNMTQSYQAKPESGQFDARSQIHPKKSDLGNILETQVVYKQNFGEVFVPHLSILDLLMCQGTEAKFYIERTTTRIR